MNSCKIEGKKRRRVPAEVKTFKQYLMRNRNFKSEGSKAFAIKKFTLCGLTITYAKCPLNFKEFQ